MGERPKAFSFARIFFRNAVNIGLYIVESAQMADEIANDDTLTIENGILTDVTTGKSYPLPPMDDYVARILEKGGLMEAVKE